jgi:hypothetical protein
MNDVNGCWAWFSTTITDVDPAESIAVENRSHKILKLSSVSKKTVVLPFSKGELEGISSYIRLAASGAAETLKTDT